MSLFSGSKKVYVSSALYNLAGDPEDLPNIVQASVLSSVLSGSKRSIGESLQKALTTGRSTQLDRFFKWAVEDYALGMPSGSVGAAVTVGNSVVYAAVESTLSLANNQKLQILSARIDDADVSYWAEQWVRGTYPGLDEGDWTASYDPVFSDILINFAAYPQARIDAPADFLWGLVREDRKLVYVAYRILTKSVGSAFWSNGSEQLFTYRIGTGGSTTLDALKVPASSLAEFYPTLPMRLSNTSVSELGMYATVSAGYKKLTGRSVDELLEQIEENEDIDDMDHVMVVQGVPLNTKDATGKAYLYTFFKSLIDAQYAPLASTQLHQKQIQRNKDEARLQRWLAGNLEGATTYNPIHGSVKPEVTSLYEGETLNELVVRMSGLPEFNFRLRWINVAETQHVGNAKTFDGITTRGLAKKGEYWLTVLPRTTVTPIGGSSPRYVNHNRIAVFRQYEQRRYSKLEIIGLEHRNFVYKSEKVSIEADDALGDDEISGFLVPLHRPSVRAMSLPLRAQLNATTSHLVINAYETVKKKWWQTGAFKIVLMAASIAISVVSGGASLAAAGGILGTNAVVGATLGATAATAAVVGAVANGIAAVVLTSLISKASVELFGEKWGAVIGTIASFVAMQVGTQFASTGSFDVDWSSVFRADNLLKLTDSVSGAYTKWLAADTAEVYQQIQEAGVEYADTLAEISEATDEILGMTNAPIDPMMLTDASEYFGESSAAFLGRTMLTGSDIAELSHAMIENFAELNLELPKVAG